MLCHRGWGSKNTSPKGLETLKDAAANRWSWGSNSLPIKSTQQKINMRLHGRTEHFGCWLLPRSFLFPLRVHITFFLLQGATWRDSQRIVGLIVLFNVLSWRQRPKTRCVFKKTYGMRCRRNLTSSSAMYTTYRTWLTFWPPSEKWAFWRDLF